MLLNHLEHFLIQTADIEATCDWYVRVLGLKEGYRPDFKFPVIWPYIGEKDVIHITQGGANVSNNRRQYPGQQSDSPTPKPRAYGRN
jgi:catechol 2,3-dioxygenase-like lactoylglutathione lyase family enzyme